MITKKMTLKNTVFNNGLFALITLILITGFASQVSGKGTVLFYETSKVSGSYKIDSGYSKFKEALIQKGYSVSKVETDLTKPLLESYDPDVLVIAGLNSPLTATEQAAVFEFVMQKGKGLFICGGTSAANQLAIPFGMTIGDAPLEDETDPIKDLSGSETSDTGQFSLNYYENFIVDASTRSIVQGVSQLGFFGGNGISLSGSTKAILVGDRDTYAPKAQKILFPKGSKPPIAASAIVGRGLVFLLSDANMLIDSNVDPAKYRYDNLRFGTNIIDWLSIVREDTSNISLDDLQVIIGSLKQEISRMNNTITTLTNENQKMKQEKERLISVVERDNEKISKMEEARFMGVEHWIIAVIIIGLALLVTSVVVAKKFRGIVPKKKNKKGSDLGYEFDEEMDELGKGEEEKNKKDEDALDIGGGRFNDDFLNDNVEGETENTEVKKEGERKG